MNLKHNILALVGKANKQIQRIVTFCTSKDVSILHPKHHLFFKIYELAKIHNLVNLFGEKVNQKLE
jgi:hypothetical protein